MHPFAVSAFPPWRRVREREGAECSRRVGGQERVFRPPVLGESDMASAVRRINSVSPAIFPSTTEVRTGSGSDGVPEKCVRVGLKFVRGLRQEAGEAIIAEREKNGWYTSIADLIDRVPVINKREIRALSLAGALNFENTIHRREALWRSELAIQPEGELCEARRKSRAFPLGKKDPSSFLPHGGVRSSSRPIFGKPASRSASIRWLSLGRRWKAGFLSAKQT